MIVTKNLSIKTIHEFTGHHLYWLTAWMLLVTSLQYFTGWHFAIPWLPLSLIGTAVAFYVGFKNSQSYTRLWEARKIWGAILNDSRKLASLVKNFRAIGMLEEDNRSLRVGIVHRHIAWVYQLRAQLLEPAPWEHVGMAGRIGDYNRKRRERNMMFFREELEDLARRPYLSEEERAVLLPLSNKAAQLLDHQTAAIQQLLEQGLINDVQQIQLQEIINNLYDEQGRAERIKRFPFPRKYASFSFIFVCIFIFLLPFGIISEFSKPGGASVWLAVPFGVIVGWVYVVMELIGDYSENPFQALHNDIPMLAMSRTIEIDMLQTLGGERQLPKPIAAKGDLLL